MFLKLATGMDRWKACFSSSPFAGVVGKYDTHFNMTLSGLKIVLIIYMLYVIGTRYDPIDAILTFFV